MKEFAADVCVLGMGSGGFAAAYTLLCGGLSVIAADKNPGPGGTSVFAGVNCWEPGVASGRVHRLLADILLSEENAAAVSHTVPNARIFDPASSENSFEKYPWGLSVPDQEADYESTLKRCLLFTGGEQSADRRFQFDPDAMTNAMERLMEPFRARFRAFYGAVFDAAETENDQISAVILRNEGEKLRVRARYFIDATGDIVLSRAAGCGYAIGAEAKETYNEQSAPEKADPDKLNGVSYVFTVSQKGESPYETGTSTDAPRAVSCFNRCPNGDINVNMLPTFTGRAYRALGEKADEAGRKMIFAYWNRLKKEIPALESWHIARIFPQAGVRESYRLIGKYVLTENEIRNGLPAGMKIAAIADHPMDVHGEDGGLRELPKPYEIPLECLLTKEFENLLVACRGASFSHIAASSARLSRTMLALGEAAGEEIIRRVKTEKLTEE